MKKFCIYKKDNSEVYFIHFSYRNAGATKRTIRTSVYHGTVDVKKASKGFIKRGYKLVESKELL